MPGVFCHIDIRRVYVKIVYADGLFLKVIYPFSMRREKPIMTVNSVKSAIMVVKSAIMGIDKLLYVSESHIDGRDGVAVFQF